MTLWAQYKEDGLWHAINPELEGSSEPLPTTVCGEFHYQGLDGPRRLTSLERAALLGDMCIVCGIEVGDLKPIKRKSPPPCTECGAKDAEIKALKEELLELSIEHSWTINPERMGR